eukprot:Phypoly_transcript_18554.p1 GENE.Phypoly_transcript_18554~~Phypoly_transcript_18554.p1  ORF type:complete len:196 (-),score=10.24 Phypoly_transcript_18554:172-708(-)
MAVMSDGMGGVEDIDIEVRIGGELIPMHDKYQSYKYLGYCQNVMDTHYETANIMWKKIETNIRIIDETPIHRWHKVTLAQWLLNSIPMYFLVNGRVHSGRLKKWNREVRNMVRKWMGTRNMANSVIYLPTKEHGLGIMDMEQINDERKLNLVTQLFHSNNKRLKESTIANLRVELGRR